jgi:hypothetical protein
MKMVHIVSDNGRHTIYSGATRVKRLKWLWINICRAAVRCGVNAVSGFIRKQNQFVNKLICGRRLDHMVISIW